MEKKKRFYQLKEIVWLIAEKKEAVIKHIDKEKLKVTLQVGTEEHTVDIWEIDKLKYKKATEVKQKNAPVRREKKLFFAKVKENAKIPKKASEEEAGYDVWACLEPSETEEGAFELYLPKLTPTLIPTGIATCVEKGFYLSFANERGSTGKLGMLVLSGIIDSSYRGEVFVNITPLYKDILITSKVEKVEEFEHVILYPYSKAICQLIDYRVGESAPQEITYDELKAIPSARGDKKLDSSGH